MGNKPTKVPSMLRMPKADSVIEAAPDLYGVANCKSCWFEKKGLIKCSNHYLCLNCLTLLLTVSNRCPICYCVLPTTLELSTTPTAPPPYEL
uniref:Zinc-binding protein n=1 Tax=Erinaceus europaeus arenavirus TaxID=3230302 RepID=A0AAU8BEC3_9VIRU